MATPDALTRRLGSGMPKLDPTGLRAFVDRDWSIVARATREARAAMPVEEKVRIAIELFEAAQRAVPGWPDDATRRADLAHHLRVRALLDRAAHVGAR